jgi:sn-glycerol 3-phosphate transport system substrate-binding protein
MKKSLLFVLAALTILSMLVSACQPAPTPAPAPAAAEPAAQQPAPVEPTQAPAPTNTPAPEPTQVPPAVEGITKVNFWHSMAGDIGGKAIPQMVNEFNGAQEKCYVVYTYQGSYDDSLNKLKAGLQSNDTPTVIQLFDIATRLMVDLDVVTPVQDFIDAENYDVSDLEPNVLAYYTVNGKQYSMPFNTSTPILYYNKDMFTAAGLDPENPPRTFEEFEVAARALTTKNADGTTIYGGAFAIYGWFFEQFLAVSGGYYADNNNGRDALATAATFNSPEGVAIMEWWKRMYDEGIMGNYGRTTVDTRNAFLAGQTAMFIDSTAVLRGMMDSSAGKFELGTAFLPRPNEEAFDQFGTIIGGGSLWMIKDRPDIEKECAWEFIKYMGSAPVQAYWQTMSGYFPIRKAAYEETLAVEWMAKYPPFNTAIDQLHAAPNNRVTNGGLIGVFPTARQTIEGAIEEILAGKSTPQEALDNAAKIVTDAIVEYNLSMGLK